MIKYPSSFILCILIISYLVGCKSNSNDPAPVIVSPKIISGYLTATSWNSNTSSISGQSNNWIFITDTTWINNFSKVYTVDSNSTVNLYYVMQYNSGYKMESPLPVTFGNTTFSYFYTLSYYTNNQGEVISSLNTIQIEAKAVSNTIKKPSPIIFKYQIIPSTL